MEEKYVLSDEDVNALSNEQFREYRDFLDTVYNSGIVYSAKLEKYDAILEQQYTAGVLYNPNSQQRYLKILAENLQVVVNAIVKVRNFAINSGSFDPIRFKQIDEGLVELKKFIERKLENPRNGSIGFIDLEAVLSNVERLENQVLQDLSFYQEFKNEEFSAISDYKRKQAEYDRLSLFGKFAARVNGKKKELTDARQKSVYYSSARHAVFNSKPGDIVNPFQYEEYLKKQQTEQSAGGKHM